MSQPVLDDAIAERPALAQPAESRWVPQQHRDRASGNHLPQSSSASRFTAGASGFLNLSQSGDLPDR
jgi:hypothetical protein